MSSHLPASESTNDGSLRSLASDVLLESIDVACIAMAIVATSDTEFVTLNQSMADLLELPMDQLVGRRLNDFRPGGHGQIRRALAASEGKPAQFHNIEVRTALGNQMHVDATLAHCGPVGGVDSLLVVLADASVRVAAQMQARRLINAVDKVSDLVSIHDLRLGVLLYANDAFTAATGHRPGDADNPVDGMSATQLDILDAEIIPTIEAGGAWTGTIETSFGNETHWLAGTIVGEVGGPNHSSLRFVTSVLTDVTSDYLRAEILEYEATHDRMTGLSNRFGLIQWLSTQRPTTDAGIAICHLDLDRFQEINDVLGHEAGDRVICEVGRRLVATTRTTDLVGRINGDEFVVAFTDVEGPQHAELLAERLKADVFAEPIIVEGHPITTTASFGLAVSGQGFSGESLLRAADVALYRAKNLGRSHIEVYTADLQVEAVRRSKMIEELREAIITDRLTVWYQPIISLATGEITSVEALVRWPLADGTFVAPDEFIPVAEGVGLVKDIDRFVLNRALADVGELLASGRPLELHVNLSATRLTDHTLAREAARTLDAHRFPASRLCLELTETALAFDPHKAETIVSELADLGIRLAIDDFGTGYSSLASLHRFRLHVLKVDRNFVQLLGDDSSEANPIVATILHLADSLGLEVVAEGIETKRQQAYFAGSSCAFGQGYLFHRPMPIEELRLVLSEQSAVLSSL